MYSVPQTREFRPVSRLISYASRMVLPLTVQDYTEKLCDISSAGSGSETHFAVQNPGNEYWFYATIMQNTASFWPVGPFAYVSEAVSASFPKRFWSFDCAQYTIGLGQPESGLTRTYRTNYKHTCMKITRFEIKCHWKWISSKKTIEFLLQNWQKWKKISVIVDDWCGLGYWRSCMVGGLWTALARSNVSGQVLRLRWLRLAARRTSGDRREVNTANLRNAKNTATARRYGI